MNWKTIVVAFMVFRFMGATLSAQQKTFDSLPRHLREVGHPLIQNYSPEEYNAFDQNWDFAQDSLGIMYIANGNGVLTYDGVNWDLIELPNKGAVFSLDIDTGGRVYVGAHGEFGYLEADYHGKLSYVSLLPFLDEKHHDFNIIRKIIATEDGIYFRGGRIVFKWDGTTFKIWENGNDTVLSVFKIDRTVYLYDTKKGLSRVKSDKLELIDEGAKFTSFFPRFILPYKNTPSDTLLIGTTGGLFLYDGSNIKPLNTDTPEFFKDNRLYCGTVLENGRFAIGSLDKGIIIMDNKGRRQNIISGKDLLRSDQVFSIFKDQSGILWAGMQSGLAKIEYSSPFSIYDEANDLPHQVLKVERYQNEIYAGTTTGLYILDSDENGKVRFEKYPGITGFTFDIINFGNELLVGSTGVHHIKGSDPSELVTRESVFCLLQSKLDTNRIFVGHDGGLLSLYRENGTWIKEKSFDDISFQVHNIVEESNGNLWLRTNANNIVRVSFEKTTDEKTLSTLKLKIFTTEDGFPDDVGKPFLIEGKLYFIASNGDPYFFDSNSERFNFDRDLYSRLGFEDESVEIDHVDADGNIWLRTQNPKKDDEKLGAYVAWKRQKGNYEVQNLNESRIINLRGGSHPYTDKLDSIVWYRRNSGGIIRHDLSGSNSELVLKPNALVNKVLYDRDSLLFGGFGNPKMLDIPFKNNQFRFKFASPSFYEEKANEFQYQLAGFDRNWSNWSSETQKDYTNIPEGDYTFKVRAKNIFGQVSEEDIYTFTIFPPWYRTWWAYLFYILGAVLLLWLFAQWQSQQFRKKNLALEAVVNERTEEIRHKNKLLNHQTEKLKELDTMKTRLFANISHEFRTPLTLIKGPIEKLESKAENTISTPNIKMIRRNANRLLNLVNQLLDLSKLDSGKLKLNKAEGDVFKCIRAAASSFSSHAASRKMDYQIKVPACLLWAEFDRDKLEKIIYNLLSNAFKFTDDEEKVVIEAEFRSSRLHLKISDKGSGISTEKLPHIFDRFFQVDDSYTREKTGSGIGLALTKELTELMGGTIFVESELNRGTLFRLVVPMEEIKSGAIDETVDEVPLSVFDDDLDQPATIISDAKAAKILIIEDNNDMRHFIREQLESDYEILEAVNGKQGLESAKKIVPDLIVTDLMMPQMDGITLCKKLKTDLATSHIPVIMLTAKAGIENKLEGLETGADEYLTKPFNARELQIRTKNLIEQRQQLRELFSKNISLDPAAITVTSLDEEFLNALLTLFEEKHIDSTFGVPQIQTELGMSKTALHAKVKALTNHPPGELLRNFRLKRAAQLLLQKRDNVSQIAYDTGFNSLSYFTRCFKEYYGSSPSEFIKKNDSEA